VNRGTLIGVLAVAITILALVVAWKLTSSAGGSSAAVVNDLNEGLKEAQVKSTGAAPHTSMPNMVRALPGNKGKGYRK